MEFNEPGLDSCLEKNQDEVLNNNQNETKIIQPSEPETTSSKDKVDIPQSNPEQRKGRGKRSHGERIRCRTLSPLPDFSPDPLDDYDYDADEHYFDNKEIAKPFEDMTEFDSCFTLMPPGEKRFILDHMIHAANVMIGEFRRLNGHLRALNARSGRIQKQVQREAEVVARGIDPRLAPRSSKNLNTSVAEAVIHLDEFKAEKILSRKKVTPTMRALLKQQREEMKISEHHEETEAAGQ